MGNQQPSEPDAGHSSGEAQPTSVFGSLFAPDTPPVGEPVLLHVYAFPSDESKILSFAERVGLGAYHSGVEAFGVEVAFDGGFDDECGIYWQKPKSVPKGADWVYKETVLLGHTTKSREEWKAILQELQPKWPRNAYHLLTNNCNHFTEMVSMALLGTGIPSWVNRLASLGATASRLRPGGIPTQEEIMNMSLLLPDLPTEPTDLSPWMDYYQTQILNENIFHPAKFVLFEKRSQKGQELFVYIVFSRHCNVSSVVIGGIERKSAQAPHKIRIFADCPELGNLKAVNEAEATFEYTAHTFEKQTVVLDSPKFSGIATMGIHFQENLSGQGETFIGFCEVIGIPLEQETK